MSPAHLPFRELYFRAFDLSKQQRGGVMQGPSEWLLASKFTCTMHRLEVGCERECARNGDIDWPTSCKMRSMLK